MISEIEARAREAAHSNTDDAPTEKVLLAVLGCATAWEPEVRLLGNVRACDISRALQTALSVRGEAEPVAYLHVMHMEREQRSTTVTLSPDHGWGDPGVHYDPSYTVTTTPLYTTPPAQAVAVKGLEWERGEEYSHANKRDYHAVRAWNSGEWYSVGRITIEVARTREEFEAAAQADYESRIRSALVPTPPEVGERVRELEAALKPFAEFGARNTDEDGWGGTRCERERINVWFGPSDFRRAARAMEPDNG